MNERILIIEDDQQILKLLQRGLAYEGYTVDTATDGRMGLILARDHTPDLVILDWMLPGMDGLEVCHRLRTGGSIPILMLTAKDTVQDRIQGLDAGADDYMIKPFNLDELLARVRALLRRTQPERVPVLKFADLSLDTGSRQASRGNRSISLTAKEYELLELFLRHPKQVLTREVIFDRVWGYDFGGESNVLEVYIRYLRQKLEGEGEAAADPYRARRRLCDARKSVTANRRSKIANRKSSIVNRHVPAPAPDPAVFNADGGILLVFGAAVIVVFNALLLNQVDNTLETAAKIDHQRQSRSIRLAR